MTEIKILDHKKLKKYINSIEFFGLNKSKVYIINYFADGEEQVDLSKCKAHCLQIKIPDIRFSTAVEGFADEHKEEFNKIAMFIKEAVTNGHMIICSCDAGVSRSAATAKAIKEFYYGTGNEVDASGDYIPSPTYYQAIMDALIEANNG